MKVLKLEPKQSTVRVMILPYEIFGYQDSANFRKVVLRDLRNRTPNETPHIAVLPEVSREYTFVNALGECKHMLSELGRTGKRFIQELQKMGIIVVNHIEDVKISRA